MKAALRSPGPMHIKSPFNPGRIRDSKGFAYAFSAKIWECLRRDEQFRDTLNGLRSRKPNSSAAKAFQEAIVGNHFAALVFGTALSPVSPDIESIKSRIEHVEWLNLPGGLKQGFEHLAEQLIPLPRLVPSPPIEPKARSGQLTRVWLKNAALVWDGWQVVAIPKIILNDRHHQLALAKLDEIIGKTKRSWVRFKPSGSVLGSAVDWDVYLFIEELESTGTGRTLAMHQAAWRFYEKDDYAAHRGDRFSALGKTVAKAAFERHGGHIQMRYGNVKDAIKSVYPAFRLFPNDLK